MRDRITYLPVIARAVGFALVVVAMIVAALHLRPSPTRIGVQPPRPSTTNDPLATELKRCEQIAELAKGNPACERAWAENRRRFFTYAPSPAPARPKSIGR